MGDRTVPVLWDEECFSSSIYKQMVQGISGSASQNQRNVEIYTSCQQLMQTVPEDRTVIVIGYETPKLQDSLTALTARGHQVLLAGLDGERFGSRVSSASPSRRQATAMLIQYLLRCGKERIALVACGDRSVNDMMRCDTLRNFLLSRGCKNPDNSIFYYQNHVEESFFRFYEHWQEFDAVICPNDYVALCLIRFCQEKGIRIPEDLYLAAFSDRMVSRYCWPNITTMSIDFAGVGNCAYQAWGFLESHCNEHLQIQITTPSRLIVRQSTASEVHYIGDSNEIIYDSEYEGGPFYSDPTIAKVMQIENCFVQCDQLNLQILGGLLEGVNYDTLSETLFISRSTLNYRLKKIFKAAGVSNRKELERLFSMFFTEKHNF